MGRDNGIEADDFVFLGTVDHQLAEELLDELGSEGIAAYSAPSNADEAEHDERVYVDEHSLSYARALLRRSLTADNDGTDEASATTTDDPDADLAWNQLIADFHKDSDSDDDPPWPQAEDLGDDEADTESDSGDSGDAEGPASKRKAKVTVVDLEADPAEDDEEHYVRPEPPKLPRGDLLTKAAWAVMLAAVVYPILAVALDWRIPGWAVALAVTCFIGGVVVHVLRIRDPHSGGDSDNGAVL